MVVHASMEGAKFNLRRRGNGMHEVKLKDGKHGAIEWRLIIRTSSFRMF